MDVLDLARWQFAITTVYHFFFVPITIGMSALVAWFHTRWLIKRNPEDMRLAKFFGKLFTINFALGLVTGIVQEFQFGMNWSSYSRFVGDIFGAPLAFEALLAFFLESTFLGLWIFGWGKLPEKLHVASIWLVHIGTVLSAYFILAANSFMQNPVGYRFNPETGRAEMADFIAVLTNKVQLVTFPHVITASYMVGGAFVMAIAFHKMRQAHRGQAATYDGVGGPDEVPMWRRSARLGAVVTLISALAVVITGDIQGKIMTEVQPMKMAAAEALYDTPPDGECAPFSVLTVAGLGGENPQHIIEIPCLLSYLGTGAWDGQVQGMVEIENEYRAKFADNELTQSDTYIPPIAMSYWNFRLMMGAGFLTAGIALLVLWFTRKKAEMPLQGWWKPLLVLAPISVVLGHSFGWIFTEIGRQPWVVFGEMTTAQGVSPSVGATDVWISMIVYTLLYGVLAVVEVKLFLDYIKKGAEPFEEPQLLEDDDKLAFSY
ncbi:cytochrome ubiquinol oxidase subunit I [Marihabitans asiaticum]|uniref:Cytochrome bd-I ubiquinol oxidase subunit 1 apoprotein n=1 Tax=Marihabitans asiaticum TaxID=415218 RepID=A0A560WED1_9MICO|nr:cytochrome ubiquinol oxidase subunit I [Marihabitans asiaticum]TWD15894.1 cytochrome bd-I ubiquinol oxidase subunit 1 apoprotein [Marihabitans asiaticum]